MEYLIHLKLTENDRPISQLSILSKALERIVCKQLTEYLEENNLLHPNHHGGRKGHNTATAIAQMYDQWVEEMEEGMLVGVMMVDLSAAFDMVEIPILKEKLKLFGLDEHAVAWMQSYLTGRKQSVVVDGKMSAPLDIEHGLAQGSVLAPLLYIIYTCDVPDLVHQHPVTVCLPHTRCHQCGSTVSYIDDNSFSVSRPSPEELSQVLTEQYTKISDYMSSHRLVINDTKTHLMVLGKRSIEDERYKVTLKAGEHVVVQSKTEKLVGIHLSNTLKWKEHILDNQSSLIKQLNSRVNGLSLVSKSAPFKSRLLLANGLVNSKICNLIQVWGGAADFLLRAVQVLQNKSARLVTKSSWFTPTRVLLRQCGWLSVNQLVHYHTILSIHKVVMTRKPKYMYDKLCSDHGYATRNAVIFGETFSGKTALAANSFCYRGTNIYIKLPFEIREIRNEDTFKRKLKIWIKGNIQID